jgi:7-cyano-7-deazaguanine synthase
LTENHVLLNDVADFTTPTGGFMQKLFGGFVVTAVALSLPVAAIAQRHASAASSSGPKREFGVDLNAAYVSPGTDGVSSGIAIITPVIGMRKSEIVRRACDLGAPLRLTWSCYQAEDVACGVCDSCRLRLQAFAEARIQDPIPYRARVASEYPVKS